MTIGPDLEHRLDSWMQEDATLPDDLAEVLAKLPETPQRRHRWSFHFDDLTWRTRSMFSATRVAAAIATFALGASITFLAGPLGPNDEPVPGQSVTESPVAPAIVSGTTSSIVVEDQGEMVIGSDPSALAGNITVTEPVMDDPRVLGTYRLTQSLHDQGGMGPMWGTMRVENEGGAWEGPVNGYWTPDTTHFYGCLIGESAYEGLTYCLRVAADTLIPYDVAFDGLVYDGGLPLVE